MYRSYGVLNVRNEAQKVILEKEMFGQISDGMWENTSPHDHWEPWCDATVVVDPTNVGRNFYARKDNYNLNNKELLEIVGQRMLEEVQKVVPGYEWSDMITDLKDLRTIFKIERPETEAELATRKFKQHEEAMRKKDAQQRLNDQAAEVKQIADELGVDIGYVGTTYVSWKDGLSYANVLKLVEAVRQAETFPFRTGVDA